MKCIFNFFLCLILVSCASPPAPEIPTAANTAIVPTNTILAPTAIPSVTPKITLTSEPSCDPFTVEFCIADGHFLLQRPIRPPGNDRIDPGYAYGSTANGTRDPHHGVEFSNASGIPVRAAAAGTVIFAGPDDEAIYAPWPDFYGNLIVIEHPGDLFTLYAHLSKLNVQANQKVAAGEEIGEVGRTGGAIGSHLHFEVRRGDVEDYFATENPELWLVPAPDESGNPLGVIKISVVDPNGQPVPAANFTIGQYSDPAGSPVKMYYATSYSPDLLHGDENTALGDLPAGQYRIAVETNGRILERWVEVQSGRLTQVTFVVE